jgi:hypothetical protein
MARIQLTDGEARLGIFHKDYPHPIKEGVTRRGTEVLLDLPNGTQVQAVAICNENDRFTRAMGRKIAASRLLSTLRGMGIAYEDRKTLFKKICPQFD